MMNAKAQALGKKLGNKVRGMKSRIIDKTSDVMSAYPRMKADQAKRTADYEVGIIHKNRRIRKYGSDDRRPARDPDSDARVVAEYQRIKSKHNR